jgi:hypothetical protein
VTSRPDAAGRGGPGTIINATVLHNTTYGTTVVMTALLCAVFVLLAYGRRQQIRGLAAAIRR